MATVNVTMLARARYVLASEWIKLRSVRSTYLVLLFAAVAAVGIGYLVTPAAGAAARLPVLPARTSWWRVNGLCRGWAGG